MMSTSTKHDLSGFIGKHLVYTYDNGWKLRDLRQKWGGPHPRLPYSQRHRRQSLGEKIRKRTCAASGGKYLQNLRGPNRPASGTDVSLIVNLGDKMFHGTIFFPRWIMNNPEKTQSASRTTIFR